MSTFGNSLGILIGTGHTKKAEGFVPPVDAEFAKLRHMVYDPEVQVQ